MNESWMEVSRTVLSE